MVAFIESIAEAKDKSIVECLFVERLVCVQKSFGVSRTTSGNSISIFHIDLPPVFGIVVLSQRWWCELKSLIPIMTGLLRENNREISSGELSPLGAYAEIDSKDGCCGVETYTDTAPASMEYSDASLYI